MILLLRRGKQSHRDKRGRPYCLLRKEAESQGQKRNDPAVRTRKQGLGHKRSEPVVKDRQAESKRQGSSPVTKDRETISKRRKRSDPAVKSKEAK